jgi:hypothetical protein
MPSTIQLQTSKHADNFDNTFLGELFCTNTQFFFQKKLPVYLGPTSHMVCPHLNGASQ